MATAKCLEGLEPKRVFEVFSELSEIPHGSKNEKAISDYIYTFCKKLGLETYQDKTHRLDPLYITQHIDHLISQAIR